MLLILNAALHGGGGLGINITPTSFTLNFQGGYRFFIKGLHGWFLDPSLHYFTQFSGFGVLAGPEFKMGKVMKFASKKSSVYFLVPTINLVSLGNIVAIGWSTGVGAEWGYLPYMSLTGSVNVGSLGGHIKFGVEFHETNYYSA